MKGFTLIEMIVVLAIIAILATLATPNMNPARVRAQVKEALEHTEDIQDGIRLIHKASGTFPEDNEAMGIAAPDELISLYITSIEVDNGVINVTFGNKISLPEGQNNILSLRPITVDANPSSPIDWVCGYAEPPDGMSAVGDNATDMEKKYLPIDCRI